MAAWTVPHCGGCRRVSRTEFIPFPPKNERMFIPFHPQNERNTLRLRDERNEFRSTDSEAAS